MPTNSKIDEQILYIGDLIEERRYQLAEMEIIELEKLACATGSADERIAHVFLSALTSRLGKSLSFSILGKTELDAGNLYQNSNQDAEHDIISAFSAFTETLPLVKGGHVLSNLAILKAIKDCKPESVHILDIGFGTGHQWLSFLEMFAFSKLKLTITGVDLPSSIENPDERLLAAGNALSQKAVDLDIDFSFRPFAGSLETLNLIAAGRLNDGDTAMLAVNASLTLHHIPDQTVDTANPLGRVLEQLRLLSPTVVTLSEPSADHNTDHFPTRLRTCLRDFSALFRALARLLHFRPTERLIVERRFLGAR